MFGTSLQWNALLPLYKCRVSFKISVSSLSISSISKNLSRSTLCSPIVVYTNIPNSILSTNPQVRSPNIQHTTSSLLLNTQQPSSFYFEAKTDHSFLTVYQFHLDFIGFLLTRGPHFFSKVAYRVGKDTLSKICINILTRSS